MQGVANFYCRCFEIQRPFHPINIRYKSSVHYIPFLPIVNEPKVATVAIHVFTSRIYCSVDVSFSLTWFKDKNLRYLEEKKLQFTRLYVNSFLFKIWYLLLILEKFQENNVSKYVL